MARENPAHPVDAGDGEILIVVGERIRILADGASTGGRAAIFEETTPPGMGPPLHRHGREAEYFYVIDGSVKFVVDGREATVHAGGFADAPRGSSHTFRNIGSTPARMLITCIPAGLERAFREADRLGREGRADPESLAHLFRDYEVEFLGPPLAG